MMAQSVKGRNTKRFAAQNQSPNRLLRGQLLSHLTQKWTDEPTLASTSLRVKTYPTT